MTGIIVPGAMGRVSLKKAAANILTSDIPRSVSESVAAVRSCRSCDIAPGVVKRCAAPGNWRAVDMPANRAIGELRAIFGNIAPGAESR